MTLTKINTLDFGFKNILYKFALFEGTSAGTVDYTGGEEVRTFLLKGHSSVKSEAHIG